MKKRIMLIVFILLLPSVFGDVFLHDYIYEGETLIIPTNGGYYEIRLMIVSDTSEKVIFSINGEITKALREREKDYLRDGSRIFVGDVLIDESGKDLVEFYFMGTGTGALSKTVVEAAALPFEIVEAGALEEEPVQLCEGCKMNGNCYPYGFRYSLEVDTTVICAEDGSWREVITQLPTEKEQIDVVNIWDKIITWISSVFQ